MTLTQLECFLAVAKERHFRKAADTLNRTQPAVSLQIQRVESELGITLFKRESTRVTLTGAGEILLPHAEKILAEAELALLRMEEIRAGRSGRVRVGAYPALAANFLPLILAKFALQFPDVEVILSEEKATLNLVQGLLEGQIDLALAEGSARNPGVNSRPLLNEGYRLGVALAHPLARQDEIAISALRHERLITYKANGNHARGVLFEICRASGFEPKVAFEVEEAETIHGLVARNLGVTILPELEFLSAQSKGVRVLGLQGDIPRRSISIYQKARSHGSQAMAQFITIAKGAADSWQNIPQTDKVHSVKTR